MLVIIVFLLFAGSLFFREQVLPSVWVEEACDRLLPTNIVIHIDSLSFGFRHGLHVRNLKLYDTASADVMRPVVSAESIAVNFITKKIHATALTYTRLPDSYYAPGNKERNCRLEVQLPEFPRYSFVLERPDILGIRPARLIGEIEISNNRFFAEQLFLEWPDTDTHMTIKGFCWVDIPAQEVYGEIRGLARQSHIRPLLVCLDVPSAYPYFDAFTEVPSPVPSFCSWKVNLVNNDFDLRLKLHPEMGKYNSVPMKRVDGDIHLHVYTRGTSLNYHQTIGPIQGVGIHNENLGGTVIVDGTNGYNRVTVKAESALPVADLLKIGGFTGEYVGDDVFGKSRCDLEFRFPRAMTNNYEVLNGRGHLEVRDGRIMRLKGFQGLVDLLAEKVPGVSWFTDSTQASCDYVIEEGVIKSENIYIEGTVFSIKMYGEYDSIKNDLDFIARVQFTKKDSMAGQILHPLALPFTKLLLEFRLTGTSENPKWEYLSVIDRIMEAVK